VSKFNFCEHYFSPLYTSMRKGKDPDLYLGLMDPDSGGPENMRIRIPNTAFHTVIVTTISSAMAKHQDPHAAIIYCTVVVLCSGAKVTLAARVDSFHESTDGHIGIEYKEDIEKKIDKVTYLN
jgi:hypothetical protein